MTTIPIPIQVLDKFSGPLNALRNQLYALTVVTPGRAIEQGMDQASRAVGGLATTIRSVLSPALAAAGVTSLSLAGIMAGLGATVRGFSESVGNLQTLSR